MGFVDSVKVTVRKFVAGSGRSLDSVGKEGSDLTEEKLKVFIHKYKEDYKRRKHERDTRSNEGK